MILMSFANRKWIYKDEWSEWWGYFGVLSLRFIWWAFYWLCLCCVSTTTQKMILPRVFLSDVSVQRNSLQLKSREHVTAQMYSHLKFLLTQMELFGSESSQKSEKLYRWLDLSITFFNWVLLYSSFTIQFFLAKTMNLLTLYIYNWL